MGGDTSGVTAHSALHSNFRVWCGVVWYGEAVRVSVPSFCCGSVMPSMVLCDRCGWLGLDDEVYVSPNTWPSPVCDACWRFLDDLFELWTVFVKGH